MTPSFSLRAAVGGLALLACSLPALHAMGSPPLITDDPGTPGDGKWEINVGVSTERRPGARASELPLIDLNYGIGDRIQLKYEVPYLVVHEDGSPSVSGLGNSAFGVKYRFFDAGEHGPAASVYPAIEFNNPGSNSDDKGLVEHGTVFLLPVQYEQEIGPVTLVAQVGREFRKDGDSWIYGVSVGHNFTEKVELAVELAGGASEHFDRSNLTLNVGCAIDVSEHGSVLFSVGRELHNHEEPKATFIGYLGYQWRL